MYPSYLLVFECHTMNKSRASLTYLKFSPGYGMSMAVRNMSGKCFSKRRAGHDMRQIVTKL